MTTLYVLVDMVNGDAINSISWKSIAHGDIKPLNILLRTSVTRKLEIVLIDYGTCGPDQITEDENLFRYAASVTHLAPNRLSNQDINNLTTGTYRSQSISAIGTNNSTNATHCMNRPPRTSGNADDLFALGKCCIHLSASMHCNAACNALLYLIL